MKLKYLRLKNFRSFYGESEIRFATGEKNITVVHGENGAGKTALLNAFKWVLYGEFTSGIQLKDQVVTKRALYEADPGETVEGYVELEFEHKGRLHLIRRSVIANVGPDRRQITVTDPEVSLQVADFDGEWRPRERVADDIGRVLPSDLHSYFFFDGERIEQIVKLAPAEQEQIAKATKKLLGVEPLDRADKHLAGARKELEKELKDVGDSQTRILIDEKQALEEEVEAQKEKDHSFKVNIAGLDEQNLDIERRLRQLEDVKALQERRDQLNEELRKRKEALKAHSAEIKKAISASAHNVFLTGPIDRFELVCEKLRERGELPAGIKRQFVANLLDNEKCICGANLTASSSHRLEVQGWLEKAGLVDVEEKALRIGGAITQLVHEVPGFLDNLDNRQKLRQTDMEEVDRIESELDDISDRLKASPKEEVASLEKRKGELQKTRDRLTRDQGVVVDKINGVEARLAEIDAELDKQQANEERQRLAKARVDAAADARSRVARIRALMEEDFRNALQERVTRLFQEISPKPYVVRIADNYSLHLIDSAGENALQADGSTGERQILSLAFIGSIIELTREYVMSDDALPGQDSSHFPIVMDSPFGALSMYRPAIAEHIPRIADQVIVMVSPSQWRGDVESAMSRRVGKQYVLRYCTSKEGCDRVSLDIRGTPYCLIDYSSDGYDFTEIVEVDNG